MNSNYKRTQQNAESEDNLNVRYMIYYVLGNGSNLAMDLPNPRNCHDSSRTILEAYHHRRHLHQRNRRRRPPVIMLPCFPSICCRRCLTYLGSNLPLSGLLVFFINARACSSNLSTCFHGRTRSDTHLGIAYLSVATFGARLLS
jgi:hypothetical protein